MEVGQTVADHGVVGGVDTHKDLHVAAVVDELDRVLESRCFATTRHGYQQMLTWMRSFGQLRRIGVEAPGTDGAGLLRYIQNAGVEVLEVTTPDTHDRRKRGKNDDLDAQNAAHAAFAGRRTVTPKSRDGMVESLRVLKACRKTAVAARRVALQMIHNTIVCAPDELRETLRRMTRMQLIRTLAAWRPDLTDYRSVVSAYRITLKPLGRRYLELHDEIADLDTVIVAIVDELAPALVARNSIGHGSAAQLLVTAGDNAERLQSEASFGQLRRAMWREPGTGFLRKNDPPSPQQRRRSGGQQCAPHHRHRTASDRSPDQGLHRETCCRRPLQARSHPMPEALHRARGLLFDQSAKAGNQPRPERRLTIRRASVVANMPPATTATSCRPPRSSNR